MATNATHAEPLVVPIGHYVGTFVPPSGSPDHHEQVRIGADVRDLDPEQFRIWGLAHGLLDRVDAGPAPWTRSALLAAAAEASATRPRSPGCTRSASRTKPIVKMGAAARTRT
jgi:hypothetical protein